MSGNIETEESTLILTRQGTRQGTDKTGDGSVSRSEQS